jgi:hypothetical protein
MKSSHIFLWFASLVAVFLISAQIPKMVSDEEIQTAVTENNKVFSIIVPDHLNFAGEEVPLNKFYVKEALENELTVNTYWHSSTLLMMKRTNRWFPVIEPILKEYGVPDDFKYLAVAESSLKNVTSPAGAKGFWQIMKSTGREYGLEVNSGIDERFHVEKSTHVACKYLLDAYEKYGSWTMAAASYNAGMNRITKETDRQDQDSYYEMNFGIETGRYIYRILAIKQILSKPKDYGFHLRAQDLYQPYETDEITVDSTIPSLADFAHKYGMAYKELKIYNPWMLQSHLPDESRRVYKIKIAKNH